MTIDKEVLGRRYPADKLAIVCARRPLTYVLIRVLAWVVMLLIMSFLLDGAMWFGALMASNTILSIWFFDFPVTSQDREVAIAMGGGFSNDISRFYFLIVTFALLTTIQLVGTRNLPSGHGAMMASVREGLTWPGRWRSMSRSGRTVRPWLITVAFVAVATWVVQHEVDQYATDLGLAVFLLLFTLPCADVPTYLTRWLPSSLDINDVDTSHAETLVEQEDKEEADRRWPPKEPLRFRAAIDVFANSPPPRGGRSERRRQAWWTGTETSVESLAIELVVQAMEEARSRGLLSISRLYSRNPLVSGILPEEAQPQGLAALVLGFHPESLKRGRVVQGRVSNILDPVYSVDENAAVITIALEDLESFGICRKKPQTSEWQLSAQRLCKLTGSSSARSDAIRLDDQHIRPREREALRRSVARQLRRKRITEGEGQGTLLQLLSWMNTQSTEPARRKAYKLPVAWDDSE